MKNIVKLCLVLSLCLWGCSSSNKHILDALHVDNGYLFNESDEIVQLKGVSTHSLCRSERLINEEAFKEIHDWNVNVIRLSMYVEAQDGYTKSEYYREKNMELINNGVEYATKNDMYVIIDWHVLQDQDPNKYIEQSKEFFNTISTTYKDYTNVIYEICNEPNHVSWESIKEYANTIIPIIRNNNQDAIIIVGTPTWSQDIDIAMQDPLSYDNILYAFHFYAASHKEDMQDKLIQCAKQHFPIFVSEYGITADTGSYPRDIDSANAWMDILDTYSISSCMWSYSKANEASAIFSSSSLKTSNFSEDDLTETGIWFKNMLKKE